MAQLIKKENITIVIGEFKDNQGATKKKYKTIGELVTMRGDDNSEYQFGEIWGPHGVTKFNVYAQDDNNQQQQNNNQGQQQQQTGGFQQNNQQQQSPANQGGFAPNGGYNNDQTPQQNGFNNNGGFSK